MDATELEAAFAQYELEAQVATADTERHRRAVLTAAIARLDERLTELETRQREAVRSYADADITERTFLGRLAEIHAAAAALQPTLTELVDASRGTDGTELARANTLRQRAAALTGPVRERLAGGLRAGTAVERVYVAASDAGAVLAAVYGSGSGGEYVREAVRIDNVDDDPTTEFESAAGLSEYVASRYPWAWDHFQSWSVLFPGGVHRFSLAHTRGSLVAYLDGSTGRIFQEVHSLRVSELPANDSVEASGDGLAVTVNHTYASGPMRVHVERSGSPVDATVSIDGTRVGATGEDGTLWTVAPHGRLNVTVAAGEDTATATLTA
jgi:hypothetical protein